MLNLAKANAGLKPQPHFDHLPITVKSLIQDINMRQKSLSNILLDKKLLIKRASLASFINEISGKVKFLICNLDELLYQSDISNLSLSSSHLYSRPTSSQSLIHDLNELYMVVEYLLDKFMKLDKYLSDNEHKLFLFYYYKKSILFYQQTSVVLKAYIRAEKDENC